MSVTIPGVPEKITRADYIRLIESVGLSAEHFISLRFQSRSVVAEVYALNEAGQRYGTREGGESIPATHQITIPVDRSE